MQILPGTFNEVLPGGDINNPYDNARAGLRYIKKMNEVAGGDPSLTAVGYYGGPGGIQKAKQGVAVRDPRNPNAPSTLEYAKQVTERQNKVSRGTPKAIQENIANLGEGYQAAYALMSMADEEPETERETEAREAAEEQSAAQQFANMQKQLASIKPASPFAAQGSEEPQQFNQGGEAKADNQGSGFNIERWIAEKIGVDQAWDKSLNAPAEMGLSEDSGTRGDAVRHMTLMREIEKKYNPTVAKTLGYAHELIGGPMQYFTQGNAQSSRDREMDLRNNAVGLELSKQAGADDAKFRELMAQALESKKADFYREEYTGKRKAPGSTAVRKRAEGSPEMGEVSGRTFEEGGPETAKKMLKDVARGVSFYPYDLIGAPVDIINMGLKGVDYVTGSKLATEKPVGGSAYLIDKSNKAGIAEKPTGSAAEELARLGSAFINPASGARATGRILSKAGDVAAKGAEKVGLEATRAITKNPDITAAQMYEAMLGTQTPPTAALRPKGGVFLGAQSVDQPPLNAFDQQVVDLAAITNKENPQDKAILDFFDKKVRKYVQTQRGTPDDPIFDAYLNKGLTPISERTSFNDLLQAARTGDPKAVSEARKLYDYNTNIVNLVPEATAARLGKGRIPADDYALEAQMKLEELIRKQNPNEPTTWAHAALANKNKMSELSHTYNFPGVGEIIKESEAGKLSRLLNPSTLPPHLRQAATSGEMIAHSPGNWSTPTGQAAFVGDLSISDMKSYLQTKTPQEIKNMGVADVAVKSRQWLSTLDLAEKNPEKFAKKLGSNYLLRGTETMFPTTNNMKWVELKDREAIVLDGRIQKLCTRGGVGVPYIEAVEKGLSKLFSLRDEKGIPQALMIADKDANGAFTIVSQVKGKANTPAKQYFNQIDDFFDKYTAKINKPVRITENDQFLPVNRRLMKPVMKRDIDENGVVYEREVLPGDPEYPDVDDFNYPVND
jgi:hypothetical protein